MSLMDYFEPYVLLEPITSDDGLGGQSLEYADLKIFSAGLMLNTSREISPVEQIGLKSSYTIILETGLILRQNDRIRRVSDGAVFRITTDSTDVVTPKISRIQFSQAGVERVDAFG